MKSTRLHVKSLKQKSNWKSCIFLEIRVFVLYCFKICNTVLWCTGFEIPFHYPHHYKFLNANPTKWSNILKQFVGYCRQIVWVCLTILLGWRLKDYRPSLCINHCALFSYPCIQSRLETEINFKISNFTIISKEKYNI